MTTVGLLWAVSVLGHLGLGLGHLYRLGLLLCGLADLGCFELI